MGQSRGNEGAIWAWMVNGDDVQLLIYGQDAASNTTTCPVHWLGPVRDDRVLAMAYLLGGQCDGGAVAIGQSAQHRRRSPGLRHAGSGVRHWRVAGHCRA